MALLGALRSCVRLAWVPLFCLSANGETVLLSGTQLRGQGKDGVLSGETVTLQRGGTIQNVLCDGDGFWIEGPGGVIPFHPARLAVGRALPKGTYKAFPDLKPGQERASVSLEIRLARGGAPTAVPSGSGSLFDGKWPGTKRQHTDCGYAAVGDVTITTDAGGRTRVSSDFLGEAEGKVVGRTLSFRFGIVGGVASGEATLELSEDGRRFTGTFSSKDGHRGKISGARAAGDSAGAAAPSPIDGLWPRTKRQHEDCGYSAASDLTITTDAGGVSRIASDFLGGATGKLVGRTCVFRLVDAGGATSSTATLEFGEDGKSFAGTFSSRDGHRGRIQGSR